MSKKKNLLKKYYPVLACSNCKRQHVKCDRGRPCQRCLKTPQKIDSCRDVIYKMRGRPKKSTVAVVGTTTNNNTHGNIKSSKFLGEYLDHFSTFKYITLPKQPFHKTYSDSENVISSLNQPNQVVIINPTVDINISNNQESLVQLLDSSISQQQLHYIEK